MNRVKGVSNINRCESVCDFDGNLSEILLKTKTIKRASEKCSLEEDIQGTVYFRLRSLSDLFFDRADWCDSQSHLYFALIFPNYNVLGSTKSLTSWYTVSFELNNASFESTMTLIVMHWTSISEKRFSSNYVSKTRWLCRLCRVQDIFKRQIL